MPEVLGFIHEWVTRAEGDDLDLLLQALDVRVDVSPEEVDIRVEVPLIGAEEGADLSPLHEHRHDDVDVVVVADGAEDSWA